RSANHRGPCRQLRAGVPIHPAPHPSSPRVPFCGLSCSLTLRHPPSNTTSTH
ncbi:hypothetical protein HETIRDRAFT_223949, partial [Heterobasidion irregulare TC 32-1]